MARPKKSAAKSSTKRTPKPAKKSPKAPAAGKRRSATRSAPGLSDDERASKLRPPPDFDDAIVKLVGVMERYKIRLPGVSASKLRSQAKAAQRRWLAEDGYRQQVEPKLRALSDARIVAEDLAWRTALDVYDLGKSLGRRDPSLAEALAFMSDYVGGGSKGPPKGAT